MTDNNQPFEIEHKITTIQPEIPSDTASRPRRHWLRQFVAATAVFAAISATGWVGWEYWSFGRFQVSTDDAIVTADMTGDGPYVLATFEKAQLAGVHAGQSVAIRIAELPGRMVHGYVDSVTSDNDEQLGSSGKDDIAQRIPVKITLDQVTARGIHAGMAVTPTIETRSPTAEQRLAAAHAADSELVTGSVPAAACRVRANPVSLSLPAIAPREAL